MTAPAAKKKEVSGAAWLRAALLLLWAAASFGVAFFARDLSQVVAGWPLNYWWLAQGGVLLFIGVVMVYAWWMGRAAPAADDEDR
jgi:cation/acetate symporter